MDATRLINANTNAYSAPARSAGQDVDPHHGVKEKFVPTGGTLVSQETLQPKAAAPASAGLTMAAPPKARRTENLGSITVLDAADVAPGQQLIKSDESATAEQTRNWGDIGRKAAQIAVVGGLGVLAPMVMPAMAQAAPAATQEVRVTTPVHANSVQDVVSRFDAQHQIYVVGNPALNGTPLSAQDMREFEEVARAHPHSYIVLVDRTTNLSGDDNALSRGIGNSAGFQSVRNAQTGEKDGVVIMFYLNVNGDANQRKIFMRAEELPDRLGVGEQNFASPTDGSPRKLLQTFINAFRNEGKTLAGATGSVFNEIDSTIARAVQAEVGNAQQSVSQAQSALNGVKPKIAQFQRAHGSGGTIGSPDVASWDAQLQSAQRSLQSRDFAAAGRTANALVQTIRSQEQMMANYEAAPGVATQVEGQLTQLQQAVRNLPDNAQAAQARQALERAQAEFQQYKNDYSAKNPSFQAHLDAAKTAVTSGLSEASDAQATAHRNEQIRNYGAAAGAVAILATGIILNHRARGAKKKADAAYEEAINNIGAKSAALLKLLDDADFHKVANYEGKTKQLADDLMSNVVDALTLVGGAEKFANEARSLIDAGGMGRIKNWFTTGNFKRAERLLTDPNEKLSFSFTDSSRKVIEKNSKAATWREELMKRGTSREFTQSLQEILLAMADNYDTAEKQLGELDKKSSEIGAYIQKIDTASADVLKQATSLKAGEAGKPAVGPQAKAAETDEKYPNKSAAELLDVAGSATPATNNWFTAPAVVDNLLPMVRGTKEEGGLLAKSRELADKNFVTAWDDYATPAERMTTEAGQIVALANEQRVALVPTILAADKFLGANQVKTDWAHTAAEQLSSRLNEQANKALRTSVADEVKKIGSDSQALEARVERVAEQDYERREISPNLIKDAEDDVSKSRQEIADQLHQFGVFKSGTPDKVMVEPERNPSDRTRGSHDNLDKVKAQLDTGNMEKAGEHLGNIRDLTADAHDLVKQSKAALGSYHKTLEERQTRTASTTGSIGKTYQPSLDRIKSTYAAVVMQKIAAEVNADGTIADNIQQAQANIKTAESQTSSAIANFDKAFLLTSRDDLNAADGSLKSAQAQLDGITNAEKLLASKQSAVESELGALTGRYQQTTSNAGQVFVRQQAKSLLAQGKQTLTQAGGVVNGTPKDPFAAKDALGASESARAGVESAIAADKQAYDHANSEIASAESDISSASGQIAMYAADSWSFSNRCGSAHVSVGNGVMVAAVAQLASASGEVNQARSLVSAQRYEEAAQVADGASRTASSAVGLAMAAHSSARADFDRQVSSLESQQRRLEAEEEAERQRQRAAEEAAEAARRASESSSSSSSYDSGSSGGSWGGSDSGGSGSTGGSF